MELKDTVQLMQSEDFKDRFIAEYQQTLIRYNRLHKMIVKYEVGKLPFTPTTPLEVLKKQASYMGQYLYTLELRAQLENIEL